MMRDCGCGGASSDADRKPFGGSFEARQERSAAGGRQGSVSFAEERGGARLFVGQVLLCGLRFEGGCAAVLQIGVEGLQVGLGDGDDGGRGSFSGQGRCRQRGKMDGDWKGKRRENSGNFRCGLLRSVDGACLCVDRIEGRGELVITLVFAVGCCMELRLLRGESGGELLRVVARGEPGVSKDNGGHNSG